MKLHEEFKLFENMWEDDFSEESKVVTESTRSVDEIRADIRRLERELDAARRELSSVRKVVPNDKQPKELYAWTIYKTEADKGEWVSSGKDKNGERYGIVFTTREGALECGEDSLANDLEYEDPTAKVEDYTVEVFAIPFSEITAEMLEESDLEYLIGDMPDEDEWDIESELAKY
jgi:hypothetical protein